MLRRVLLVPVVILAGVCLTIAAVVVFVAADPDAPAWPPDDDRLRPWG